MHNVADMITCGNVEINGDAPSLSRSLQPEALPRARITHDELHGARGIHHLRRNVQSLVPTKSIPSRLKRNRRSAANWHALLQQVAHQVSRHVRHNAVGMYTSNAIETAEKRLPAPARTLLRP